MGEVLVKLSFDPEYLVPEKGSSVEREDARALQYLFKRGGAPLRLWALWKRNRITCQYFLPALVRLQEQIDLREELDEPPYDLDWFFMELIANREAFAGCDLRDWVVEHWDHFNPAIQRKVTLIYERVEPTEKKIEV